MKVHELIAELQKYSPEATVRVSSSSEEYELEVAEVYLNDKIVCLDTLEVEEPEEEEDE